MQKTNQKEFRIETVIKRKGSKLHVKRKGYNDSFNSWIEKKDLIKWLSTYATKNDLTNVTHVDVSSFASKTNLASLKTEVDKIDVDKLKTVPVDLAKLSNVVKSDVVKKTEYDKLVSKVNGIDTTSFVKKK